MPVLLLSTTCDLKMWQNVQAYAPRICLRRSHSKTCQSCRGWTFWNSPSKVSVTHWLQAPILFEMLCHGQPGLELIGSLISNDFNTIFGAGVCLSPKNPIFLCPSAKACVATLITRPRQLPGPYHALSQQRKSRPCHWLCSAEVKVDAMKSTAQRFALFAPQLPLLYLLRFWIRLSAFGRGTKFLFNHCWTMPGGST